jgi:hypothetical protein
MILSAAVVAAVPWAACGGGGNGNTTSTGTGGTSSTSSSKATTTSVGTSMGGNGSGGACAGILNPGGCDDCITMSCCTELANCNNDANCGGCLAGSGMNCNTDPLLMALGTCEQNNCQAKCTAAPPPCDPITNAGCNSAAGEACDFGADANGNQDFQCYPAPNTGKLCDMCDLMTVFCEGGYTCNGDGLCAKFCCDDGDCAGTGADGGGGGVCVPTGLFGVGFCATDMMDSATACNVPLVSPSNGSCVMGFGTGGADGGTDAGTGGGGGGSGSDAGSGNDAGSGDDAGSDAGDGGP